MKPAEHRAEYRKIQPPRGDQTLFLMGKVSGWGPEKDGRLYEVTSPEAKNGFYAQGHGTGGLLLWTSKDKGPKGEPIKEHRRYLVLEGRGFITETQEWDGILGFLDSMRFELESFEYSKPSRKGGK